MYRELIKLVNGDKFPKRDSLSSEVIYSLAGVKGAFYSHFAYKYNTFKSHRIIDHIVLDFDFDHHDNTQEVMNLIYTKLKSMEVNFHTYFSGNKGFHVVLPNVWGFTSQDISNTQPLGVHKNI